MELAMHDSSILRVNMSSRGYYMNTDVHDSNIPRDNIIYVYEDWIDSTVYDSSKVINLSGGCLNGCRMDSAMHD